MHNVGTVSMALDVPAQFEQPLFSALKLILDFNDVSLIGINKSNGGQISLLGKENQSIPEKGRGSKFASVIQPF